MGSADRTRALRSEVGAVVRRPMRLIMRWGPPAICFVAGCAVGAWDRMRGRTAK